MSVIQRKSFFVIICLFFGVPLLLGGFSFFPAGLSNFRFSIISSFILLILFCIKSTHRQFFFEIWSNSTNLLNEVREKRTLLLITTIYLIAYIKFSLFSYYSFNVNAVDFSIIDYLIPNTSWGKFMYSQISGASHFSIHSTPIMLLLYPIHRVFNNPIFLLILHPIIIWSAYIPLYKLSVVKNIRPFLRLMIVFLFFNFFWVASILNYHFHYEVFYLPLFFWLAYFWEKNFFKSFIFISILINSIKEDGALYLIAFCAALFIVNRKKVWPLITVIIMSFVIFFINIKIVMPYFADSGKDLLIGSKYGGNLTEIIFGMLKNIHVVIFDYLKGNWIIKLSLLFFLPVYTLFFWIASFPFAIIHTSSAMPTMKGLSLYYSAPFVPIVFYSLIIVLSKEPPHFIKKIPRWLLLIPLLICIMSGGYFKFKKIDIFQYENFLKVKDIIMKKDGQVACVQGCLLPHFSYNKDIRFLDHLCLKKTYDLYLYSVDLNPWPFSKDTLRNIIRMMKQNDMFDCSEEIENFILCKRVISNKN